MSTEFKIGNRVFGGKYARTFIVAEAGINHGGSLHKALEMADAAADCGADAIKFQTFQADRLLIPAPGRYAQQGAGLESAYDMFRRMQLGWREHERIKAHAEARGILFFSTPFDEESVDRLDEMGVEVFKVASADITHFPLLRHIAAKGKPVLLSTGMSFLEEVSEAVGVLKAGGAKSLVLLHCVSSYPAVPESLNLNAISTLRSSFGLPVGYSDHSQGILAPLCAVALGAHVIEKHFTLDKAAPGPDHKLSLDPKELNELVRTIRIAEQCLGDGQKIPTPLESEARLLSRRSIVAAMDIEDGQLLKPEMLTFKRPGTGLPPSAFMDIVGMRATASLPKNSIIRREDLLSIRSSSVSSGSETANQSSGRIIPDSPISKDTSHV